jgi:hypothetical protein
LTDDNGEFGVWLFALVWKFMGGIGIVTLVFFFAFVAFAIFHSRKLIFTKHIGHNDTDILGRYLETSFSRIHAKSYIITLGIYVVAFLCNQIWSNQAP